MEMYFAVVKRCLGRIFMLNVIVVFVWLGRFQGLWQTRWNSRGKLKLQRRKSCNEKQRKNDWRFVTLF